MISMSSVASAAGTSAHRNRLGATSQREMAIETAAVLARAARPKTANQEKKRRLPGEWGTAGTAWDPLAGAITLRLIHPHASQTASASGGTAKHIRVSLRRATRARRATASAIGSPPASTARSATAEPYRMT